MDRLQPVAYIGQRARHDNAHSVVEIRHLHLVLNIDLFYLSNFHQLPPFRQGLMLSRDRNL